MSGSNLICFSISSQVSYFNLFFFLEGHSHLGRKFLSNGKEVFFKMIFGVLLNIEGWLVLLAKKKKYVKYEGHAFIFTPYIYLDVPVTFLHPSCAFFAFCSPAGLSLLPTTGPSHRLSLDLKHFFCSFPFLLLILQTHPSFSPLADLPGPSIEH